MKPKKTSAKNSLGCGKPHIKRQKDELTGSFVWVCSLSPYWRCGMQYGYSSRSPTSAYEMCISACRSALAAIIGSGIPYSKECVENFAAKWGVFVIGEALCEAKEPKKTPPPISLDESGRQICLPR